MKLRIASTVLWFLAGWFLTGAIATALGMSSVIGPLVGVAWGTLIAIDPLHLLWRDRSGSSSPARMNSAIRADG